jgi:hypothetical protein
MRESDIRSSTSWRIRFRLVLDDREEARTRLGIAPGVGIVQGFDKAEDRGQRRAQLVAGVGDEIAPVPARAACRSLSSSRVTNRRGCSASGSIGMIRIAQRCARVPRPTISILTGAGRGSLLAQTLRGRRGWRIAMRTSSPRICWPRSRKRGRIGGHHLAAFHHQHGRFQPFENAAEAGIFEEVGIARRSAALAPVPVRARRPAAG